MDPMERGLLRLTRTYVLTMTAINVLTVEHHLADARLDVLIVF
jgi:hypothetical protein